MINAKQELLNILKHTGNIRCAHISLDPSYWKEATVIVLKLSYSIDEYLDFLKALNFEYDNGFGMQYLYGNVWLRDGTWLARHEYDGAENWIHATRPEIPVDCI